MAPMLPLPSETSARLTGSFEQKSTPVGDLLGRGAHGSAGGRRRNVIFFCGAGGRLWPGAGAAPVSRGVRSLGSTCRRGNVTDRRGPRLAGVRKRSIRHSVERSVVGRQYCHRAGAGAGKTLASSIEAYLRRPGVKGSNALLGEYWVLYYLHLPTQLFRRLSHMGVSPTWRKQYL
jgi:hypothetical protein